MKFKLIYVVFILIKFIETGIGCCAEIYKFEDEYGVIHFTDLPTSSRSLVVEGKHGSKAKENNKHINNRQLTNELMPGYRLHMNLKKKNSFTEYSSAFISNNNKWVGDYYIEIGPINKYAIANKLIKSLGNNNITAYSYSKNGKGCFVWIGYYESNSSAESVAIELKNNKIIDKYNIVDLGVIKNTVSGIKGSGAASPAKADNIDMNVRSKIMYQKIVSLLDDNKVDVKCGIKNEANTDFIVCILNFSKNYPADMSSMKYIHTIQEITGRLADHFRQDYKQDSFILASNVTTRESSKFTCCEMIYFKPYDRLDRIYRP
jgi:hypothetical protein